MITGRRKEAVDKAAAELGVSGYIADQGQVAAIEALASQVREKYGKIDILFINAGVVELGPIENATEKSFDPTEGDQGMGARSRTIEKNRQRRRCRQNGCLFLRRSLQLHYRCRDNNGWRHEPITPARAENQ
jgi:hypothetical protein